MTIAAQVSDVAHGPYAKQKTNVQLMFWEATEYYFYLVVLFIDNISLNRFRKFGYRAR